MEQKEHRPKIPKAGSKDCVENIAKSDHKKIIINHPIAQTNIPAFLLLKISNAKSMYGKYETKHKNPPISLYLSLIRNATAYKTIVEVRRANIALIDGLLLFDCLFDVFM